MAEKQPAAKILRTLPEADIRAQLDALRQELWDHRLKTKEGAQQKVHVIAAVRRQIARIHTVLREQRVAAKPTQGARHA